MTNKKQKLLLQKENLLNEINYFKKRIEDANASGNSSSVYEDDSSDSEIDFSLNSCVPLSELRMQKSRLLTCVQAMEELTGLTVLQFEVNILPDAPTLEGEAAVAAGGVWREVIAECRIDLVAFSITFYTHQSSEQSAASFHALSVLPAKPAHERELAGSVLHAQHAPADALEVVRSFARAHRSRRTSLAWLADRHAPCLRMDALPEGGYSLRCAGLLRAAWSLHNRRSPLAPFHHKLSFDLDYMDEAHVKTITQAYKQLCEPALDTDARTALLAEIIDTCLEARAQTGPDKEDAENSPTNPQAGAHSLNTKQPEPEEPETNAPIPSSEIMGPPKSLPKKNKPKGKENLIANERKRSSAVDDGSGERTAKKPKIANPKNKIHSNNAISKISNKKTSASDNTNLNNPYEDDIAENANFSNNESENADKGNKNAKKLSRIKSKYENTVILKGADLIKEKDTAQTKSKSSKSSKNKDSSGKCDKNNDAIKIKQNRPANVLNTRNSKENESINPKIIAAKNIRANAMNEDEPKTKKSKMSTVESTLTSSEYSKHNQITGKNTQQTDKTVRNVKPNSKNDLNKEIIINKEKNYEQLVRYELKTDKNNKNKETILKYKTNTKKDVVQKPSNIQTLGERFSSKNKINTHNMKEKLTKANILNDKNKNSNQNLLIDNNLLPSNINSSKNNEIIQNSHKNNTKSSNSEVIAKLNRKNYDLNKDNLLNNKVANKVVSKTNEINRNKILQKQNNVQIVKNVPKTHSNNKLTKALGVRNNMKAGNKEKSKIPQKRLSFIKPGMKNPLRISPRRHQSNMPTTQDSSKSSSKGVQKQTNIPRLVKKPRVTPNPT